MAKRQSDDTVRKHLQQSKALGKQMSRSGEGVVRSLRRAASSLRRYPPATSN
jgi:hypothetical protein